MAGSRTAPRAIMLFSRSLRTADNRALEWAAGEGYEVVPVFVFTPEQIDPAKNPYYSRNAVQFMVESLRDLAREAPMVFLEGTTVGGLDTVTGAIPGVVAVVDTVDYTPYARKRSAAVAAWCAERGLRYQAVEDLDLFGVEEVLRAPGEPYKVFTPYYHKAIEAYRARYGPDGRQGVGGAFSGHFVARSVVGRVPGRLRAGGARGGREDDLARFYGGRERENPHLAERGGRTEALRILARVPELARDYGRTRDHFGDEIGTAEAPGTPGTTRLSAHLKFGTVSVREVAAASVGGAGGAGLNNGILRQLVFRSFYYKNMWFRPEQLAEHKGFKSGVVPPQRPEKGAPTWEQFLRAETGVPLLDASVRCLETTGYLHNRLRLLVASYVTKDMAVPWPVLERWFAQRLVDYDPISNNAGAQTGASVGPSAGPMFRRLSPEAQARKYDPDGAFVRRWGPGSRDGTEKKAT